MVEIGASILKRTINYLAVASDTHCGSTLGLCPPQGVPLDDGGDYYPSELQKRVWQWWEEFWNWVDTQTGGEPYAVCCNGDSIEGQPHGSVAVVSPNWTDQVNIAVECWRDVVKSCKGRYYHIRGTEAHVGKSGQFEEQVAKRLGARPNSVGQHARPELWIRVGEALVHVSHHIGTSGSMAYETSAVQKELEQMLVESARSNVEPPRVIIRSHRHSYVETRKNSSLGMLSACTTPGWQLKTPFAYKVAGARRTQPDFGGVLVCFHKEDKVPFVQAWQRTLDRPEPEIP
jgi:hypothetical protein